MQPCNGVSNEYDKVRDGKDLTVVL